MSAYRIAVESASSERRGQGRERGPGATEAPAAEDLTQSVFDRLTKWIPGDTLASCAPGMTLISSSWSASLFLLVLCIVTPLFVIGVAQPHRKPGTCRRAPVRKCVAAQGTSRR
jgi:hypothetical protein